MNSVEQFDRELARKMQEEYDREIAAELENESNNTNGPNRNGNFTHRKENNGQLFESGSKPVTPDISPVDPSLEYTDPNPEIRELFIQYNYQFFWGKLSGIEVKWSPRMTLCAGLCVYEGRGGLCSVRLSLPLLKLRPRKDLVETLLHEMIHAFLFITNNDRDHDGHGPQFQGHMHRINHETGANISIYHTFHDEVESYQKHWWRCDGPCQNRKPFYGYVKRAMNRAPSANDFWWAAHQASCGGTYTKIKEPEGYGQKKGGKKEQKAQSKDIRSFGGKGSILGSTSTKKDNSVGSIKNPATIFNIKNASKPSTSSASSSGKSQSSSIVNGIIYNGTQHRNSPPISNVSNTNAQSKIEKKSTHLNEQSSSKPKTESWAGDDDDLWMIDIDDGVSVPLSKDKDGDDFKQPIKSGDNHVTKQSNYRKTSSSFFKDPRKKKSVCEGGFFDKGKKKGKKKYILDELDSNDHLWDFPSSDSMPVKSEVSPLKGKLEKFHMNEKDKVDKNSILQYIKSEKPSASSSHTNVHTSYASNRTTFPGHGFRLGSVGQSTSSSGNFKSSSWISKTFDSGNKFKGFKKIKDEHQSCVRESENDRGASVSGQKRSSDEAFVILDDSEEEDDDSSLLSSKKSKCDPGLVSNISGSSAFGNEPQESDESNDAQGGHGTVLQKKVACPVCSIGVLETDINTHLDMCLQT